MTTATLDQSPATPPVAVPPRTAGDETAGWEIYGTDPLKILDARLGTMTVSFRGPLAASAEDVEVLALRPLADLLRERLLRCPACRDWRLLVGRVTDAERDLAALAEKKTRAEREVQELPTQAGLTGEKLASRISKAQAEAEALAGRISTARSGVALLQRRANQARQAVDEELQRLLPVATREIHDRLRRCRHEAYRALAEGGGGLLSVATTLHAAISRLASQGRSLDLDALMAEPEAAAGDTTAAATASA